MPAAAIFVESGSGQATRRSALFGLRVVVRVFDEMGNWMPGEMVSFALPSSPLVPSGRFPGDVPDYIAATDAEGRASSEFIKADDLLGTWVGTVEVVSAPLVRADFYLSNVVTPFAATQVQITANGTQTVAQYADYLPVTARLTDGLGNGVPSEFITMTCDASLGSFPGGGAARNALTDAGGSATFPIFTASGVTGNFLPAISYPAITQVFANFTTIDPAIPASMSAYSGNNQHTPPNFLFNEQLVVRVANGVNAPVAGVAVTFDAPNSGASLIWASPFVDPVTRTTDVNGMATSPSLTANTTLGTYNVFVTSSGVPFITFQLTNGGAPPVPDSSALALCEV